jgi:hypothetical protein
MRRTGLVLAATVVILAGGGALAARADDDRAEIEREYLERRAELDRDYQRALREERREDARRYEEALRRERERHEGRSRHVVRREVYDRSRDFWAGPPVLVAPGGARLGYRGITPDGPVTYAPDYAPPQPPPWYGPPDAGPAAPVLAHAALLTSQVQSFLQVFGPTVRDVPEGEQFYREAGALAEASRSFQELLASGADPAALAEAFRRVEGRWTRLARRTERIAGGRTGPNIQQVQLMGTTLDAIRRDWPY